MTANCNGKTGIIGLGYVGLPLAIDFCEAGLAVTGFDVDEGKIRNLTRGESYISYLSAETIAAFIQKGMFKPTADFNQLAGVENILITVPTPLNPNREPDLSFVVGTAETIRPRLRPGHLVILESTTYPGTTREVLLPRLEESGLKVGEDFFLAYSSERVDPNNLSHRARDIPKVVGGITPACRERALSLYSRVFQRMVPVSSVEAAEASKLLENIFRSVNIALVNEMKVLFDRMGIDIWEVVEAASTKPFGFMPFTPGPGLGGHCIPIDPFYLTWKARQYDLSTRFVELAGEINTAMPYYVMEKTADALNSRGKSLHGSRILVLGAAYKKDVDDSRESPALKIISLLMSKEAEVSYHDPYIPRIRGIRKYPELELDSVNLSEQTLRDFDCVIVVTDHSCYDFGWILENSSLVVDTRNALKRYDSPRIFKA